MAKWWGRYAAAALLLGLWHPGGAAALDATKVVAELQDRYGRIESLSVTFRQESRVVSLGRTRSTGGTMYFRKPGLLRWEYGEPDPQVIVSDGDTLWFHRPSRNQVIRRPLGEAFARQSPLLFLFGRGDLDADFTWEPACAPAGPGTCRIRLRPRRESPDLVALTIDVAVDGSRLLASEIEDAFGNTTRLIFRREEENPRLSGALFSFRPPPGTEVVEP